MRNIEFANGEIYHVFNRGTEKRDIFLTKEDYVYFLTRLIVCNTQGQTPIHVTRLTFEDAMNQVPENPLVKYLAFGLIPNHFHLELKQVAEKGISRLLHRLQMAQAKYFNAKYNHSGHLFQGAFKAKHVNKDSYLMQLPLYIHMNSADLLPHRTSIEKTIDFITTYPWSSLKYYVTGEKFPHLEMDEVKEIYSSPEEWKQAIREWLPRYRDLKESFEE